MNDNKKKLIISAGIFILGLIGNLFFSTFMHYVFMGKMKTVRLIPIIECFGSIFTNKNHLVLFLCLQGLILTLSGFFYFANNKPYQSKLITITELIKIPVPTGQYQHGSARFLTPKEKEMVFSHYTLDTSDAQIKELLEQGFVDIEKQGEEPKGAKPILKDENTVITCGKLPPAPMKGGEKRNEEKSVNDEPTPAVAEKSILSKGGVAIGMAQGANPEKLFYISEDSHTLCIGATRSGKSRTIVLQTICTLVLAGESMILSDPKGELYTYCYPFLERLGYEVIAIDFKNPLKSTRYNFLQPVIDCIDADDLPRAIEKVWDITNTIVPKSEKGEPIWTNGEESIIASAIMAVVWDNKEVKQRKYQNMTNVYYFIAEMCKPIPNTNGKMPILEYLKQLPAQHPAKALLAISEVAPSKTRSSFYTSALTTLRLFTNPLINAMTKCSDYDPRLTGTAKRAIFMILPDERTTYYTVASLFISQHYEILVKVADDRGGRLERRVNFILDEFGNFAQIADFATKLTVGGGRGMRFNLFLQSFSQLDEKYGKDVSKTIRSNCQNWIYLQADDPETLDEFSKKLGNYTVSTYSLSASHQKFSTPSSSHSINLTARALLTSDEVRLISRPYCIVTSRNHPALMYAPDISKMQFNKMLGLGDEEHNRKLREARENRRPPLSDGKGEMDLWGIWDYFVDMSEGESPKKATYPRKQSMKG